MCFSFSNRLFKYINCRLIFLLWNILDIPSRNTWFSNADNVTDPVKSDAFVFTAEEKKSFESGDMKPSFIIK